MAYGLGGQLLYVSYLLFLLSMVIVGLVFLTDNISDNKAVIPGFNNTMYNFLYVGLWIIVAVTAIQFLIAFFALGYILNRSVSVSYITVKDTEDAVEDLSSTKKSRRKRESTESSSRRTLASRAKQSRRYKGSSTR